MSSCHCNDFSRTQRLHASAGNGLPAIEPGMPMPAGTGLSRRSFVTRASGLALSVYGASMLDLPLLQDGVEAAGAHSHDRPILVNVFLAGGVDSMTLLAPVGDPRYRQLRPKLHLPEDKGTAFSEDERLRWHPTAQGLAQLHAEGKVSVFPAIGYDHPDQSHFTSRHFWEVGALNAQTRTGWMGRYLDRTGSADNPLQGLALDGSLAPALATGRVPVAAVAGPENYSFWGRGVWGEVHDRMLEAFGEMGAPGHRDPTLAATANVLAQAGRLREQLSPFVPKDEDTPAWTSPVKYPSSEDSSFPSRMAGLAAMLGAGMPLHCVSITGYGQYDTHEDQKDNLSEALQLSCDTLLAFQRDLEARGLADRVVTLVWSEFGRRPEENGSGTDHGAAGCAFLIGNRVAGKMVGEFPGLAKLDAIGNLRATSDFRGLYCGLLEQWLHTDPAGIIPEASRFARPHLIR